MEGFTSMTRTMPEFPKDDLTIKDHHPGMESRTYEIEVITPIFGGGVEAGKVDQEHPIRESSIRGHLRFWWRATRGVHLAETALHLREEEIWGSSTSPSPVVVEVQQSKKDLTRCIGSAHDFNVIPGRPDGYVLFSAKEATSLFYDEKNKFSFNLTISWSNHLSLQKIRDQENAELKKLGKSPKPAKIEDITSDIKAALLAWVNFGGIGARTRRGCGALYCKELALSRDDDFKKFPFRIFFNKSSKSADPLDVWYKSIEPLRKFRQDFRGPEHQKRLPNRPNPIMARGRSYWPEPDSIRNITGCSLRPPNLNQHDHSKSLTPIEFFPRAQFGLPIIFHFGDGPRDDSRNPNLDPPDVTLIPVFPNGKDGTRMASPVITRPIQFKDEMRAPMIVILKPPNLSRLRLIDRKKNCLKEIHADQIQNPTLAKDPKYGISPLGKPKPDCNYYRSPDGSALDAFLSFAENEEGFTEVPK